MMAKDIRSDPSRIATLLLAHYDRHARRLPWRAAPGANSIDPYRVWLSEIMLQQTTVAAAAPYFARFVEAWPGVGDLADAPDADVMAAWAGLGYYARARNLLACARVVSRDLQGRFPDTEEGLLRLPGIGPYTAAAIAAIAFGRRAVVVDANVERVVARLFAIATPLPEAHKEIRAATDLVTPTLRSGDFAQAMMDLGAGLCSVRSPSCLTCPLRSECLAAATAEPARFPVKAARQPKPLRRGTAWWIERNGEVRLVRRPERGMLGGMRALPGTPWGDAPDRTTPFEGSWHRIAAPVRHVFTHFSLDLDVAWIDAPHSLDWDEDGEWWPVDDLPAAGLPTLYLRAARAVADARTAPFRNAAETNIAA